MAAALPSAIGRRIALAAAAAARGLHTGGDWRTGAHVVGAHLDTYYSRTATSALRGAAVEPAQRLTGDTEADTVIIGGGFAGVNTALALVERSPTHRVVLLEANRLGWAASGRNGGFAHPGYSLNMSALAKAVGVAHARALWDLTFESLATMRARVAAWSAAGGEHSPLASTIYEGMLTASWFDDEAGMRSEVEEGNAILGREYFEFWPRARVNATYSTKRYYDGVYDPLSFHFHSLNYAEGVAAAARCVRPWCLAVARWFFMRIDVCARCCLRRAKGARLYECSPAAEVSLGRPGEGRVTVTTRDGARVKANQVVLCGSAYMASLRGVPTDRIRRAILPVMTYACVTEPLGAERLASLMKARHCVTGECAMCRSSPLPQLLMA